jgi:hypothetical protein
MNRDSDRYVHVSGNNRDSQPSPLGRYVHVCGSNQDPGGTYCGSNRDPGGTYCPGLDNKSLENNFSINRSLKK